MIRPASVLTAFAVIILTASTTFAQGMPGYIPPGMTRGQNVINYRVNQHGPSWNDRQPIEAFLTQLGRRSWFRMDYLHWDVEGPGRGAAGFSPRRADRTVDTPPVEEVVFFGDIDALAGVTLARDLVTNELPSAHPLFAEDQLRQFTEVDFINTADGRNIEENVGAGFIPGLSRLSLNDAQGVRGTYGIWLDEGALEFSVFGGGTTDRFSVAGLNALRDTDPNPFDGAPAGMGSVLGPNVVIPFQGDLFLAFDESYRMSLNNQFWGSEFNYLSAPVTSGLPVQMQWLGGLRYLSYDERFRQAGVYTNGGLLDTPTTFQMRSSTINNTYGPTIGFRTLFDSRYLTLSVTPRVTFALNNYTAKGSSEFVQLADFNEPPETTSRFQTDEVDFTTVAQVSFSAELHPTESFTLFAGYDFLWNYNVARASNQGIYGTAIVDDELNYTDITFRDNPESLLIQGVSFGAAWRF